MARKRGTQVKELLGVKCTIIDSIRCKPARNVGAGAEPAPILVLALNGQAKIAYLWAIAVVVVIVVVVAIDSVIADRKPYICMSIKTAH